MFFKEVTLQLLVFIMLPVDLMRKWDSFNGNGKKIVFLLPGYTETQFIFYSLKKHLQKEGVGYITLRYKPFLGSLTNHTDKLEMLIEEQYRADPNIKIYIVGHSMGGLIGRMYFEKVEGNQIQKLIMISTPHEGTILAKLGFGESSRDILPKSNFIKMLKEQSHKNITNIYSTGDNLIIPSSSLKYFNENHILNKNYLHNSSMFSTESISIIKKELGCHGHI